MRRLGAAALTTVLLLVAPACDAPVAEPAPLGRSERLGILRDLELFPRSARLGGPFFLDRFETTRADWLAWRRAALGGADPAAGDAVDPAAGDAVDPAAGDAVNPAASDAVDPLPEADAGLPAVGMDLYAARAFARWRLGRLPRYDEWLHAASGGGLYRRPWGDVERFSWANTKELGAGGLTPVGAFEAGRQPGGPYDLIGNAGEWTESPDPRFLPLPIRIRDLPAIPIAGELALRLDRLQHGLARFGRCTVPGAPWPYAWVVAVDSARLPRLCPSGWTRPVSAASLGTAHFWAESWWFEARLPGETSSVLGLRVASDPDTLVAAVAALRGPLAPAEVAAIREFLARDGVRPVLREAALRAREQLAGGGPAAALLRAELGL